ncbi:hypothetical protein PIB30_083953 [Stylosanthes scabra]|uniref:Putative plant transposon protein domain-containing protein n=1 Tax=Stylosanthes scabra TaxID=79078 RepID=A0ABU6UV17_9FABA|nr:hypothetical protein [Stylosanthes scabra]
MHGTLTIYTLTIICPNPSHVLSPITHAYAYNPTHMRDPHIPHLITLTPCPNTPHLPRICVQLYAYAWKPQSCTTPSSPHRACPRIDHFYAIYNTIVKNKKVIAECCIDLDEDKYPEVKEQISLRGWRRLSAPKQEISIDLIHEFYANAVVTEEEIEEAGGHTFRSFVRCVPVDFSPGNIQTVMRFRTRVQGAVTDFETRKEHDLQLDQVLADLCMPGATWKLSTGQLRVPIQLRRQELNPVARGWHEFSIHSLIPSSNRSKIPVIRAILIHCIMRGEDVRAEDIMADKIVRMAQGIKEKGKLGFLAPFTSYARRLECL